MTSFINAPTGANDHARPQSDVVLLRTKPKIIQKDGSRDWRGSRARPLTDAFRELDIMRHFSREWLRLPAPQVKLLLFLFGQTVLNGTATCTLSRSVIEEGNGYTAGTGVGRSRVSETIKALEEAGAIEVVRPDNLDQSDGLTIRVNVEWNPKTMATPR